MKAIKKIGLFILILIYLFLLFLLVFATGRIVSGSLPGIFIDEMFLGILVFPILTLSPLVYSLIKHKKLTLRFVALWLLMIGALAFLSAVYLKNYRPGLVYKYCEELAKGEGNKEARKKGYNPGSDTYFVVSELTKQRVYGECLYEYRLTKEKPSGWIFDWLPDVNP